MSIRTANTWMNLGAVPKTETTTLTGDEQKQEAQRYLDLIVQKVGKPFGGAGFRLLKRAQDPLWLVVCYYNQKNPTDSAYACLVDIERPVSWTDTTLSYDIKEPLHPKHPYIHYFFNRVEEILNKKPCKCDGLQIAKKVLKELRLTPNAINETLEWVEGLGGYCDCEILMNTLENIGEEQNA